jgi:hypothetical protein
MRAPIERTLLDLASPPKYVRKRLFDEVTQHRYSARAARFNRLDHVGEGFASAPTSPCPSESAVSQAIGVLVRPTLPLALRVAKIDVDVGRQR